VELRPLVDADWPQVFALFTGVVADGRTYAYPEGLTSDEARALWVERPPGTTVVAVEDGAVLGTAKAGPNRPGRGDHVATASFMVAPQARGRGVGRALGEHVLAWCREQGFLSVQFNAVVETNAPAVALWRSLGFRVVGTVPRAFRHPDHGLVGLHVMVRDL
jgi:L-amino acid N-acyltransferase YncA